MTSIKFTSSGCCAALGNFAPGDIARNLPADLARHLVQEAACAQYQQPSASAQTPEPVASAPAPKRQKKTPPTQKDS